MLTYSFESRGNDSLYEHLYKCITRDIISGSLSPHEKLPSKRALAEHLNISTITVENAYSQLIAEGFIYSKPRSGFYVSPIPSGRLNNSSAVEESSPCPYPAEKSYTIDLAANASAKDSFPFSVWTRLMREVMSDKSHLLTVNSPSVGIRDLRLAISDYLFQFRGMRADPECIIVGAGTEYLYSLIIQLLGRGKKYAVEDPGYLKISQIYKANNVECRYIPLDKKGVDIAALEKSGADILHISPSHHFPTGKVTPVSRRYELLSWAHKQDSRYIIEDDYDSEFRFTGRPIPSLQSIDSSGKVIYINTFSKSLTSTIRISYMVLPKALMELYKKELSFYSCTVSNFEQYTLAAFIAGGYYEKHINRMRNYYRSQRDSLMNEIAKHPFFGRVQIKEEDAGLHFLMKIDTRLTDSRLIEKGRAKGINLACLSGCYHNGSSADAHTLIINYSGLSPDKIKQAVELLFECIA